VESGVTEVGDEMLSVIVIMDAPTALAPASGSVISCPQLRRDYNCGPRGWHG